VPCCACPCNDDFIDVVRYDAASLTLLCSVFNENKMQFTMFLA
jgi:ABC-type transporter Mla MlaB component